VTKDQKERELALDPAQSFIVEAPAGSGKTALLTHRYLRLLSVVERPESIVAMTFTRKAAAEMKERIHQALQGAQSGSPAEGDYQRKTRELAMLALEQDRRKGWNLLADPAGRMQIQTIDALCAMLTRQMPVVSEFGGVSEVIENAGELYRIAARRTLRNLAEGSEDETALFRTISLHFDNDLAAVEGQVTRMLERRDQWHFLAPGDHPPLIDAFYRLLDRAREELREVFRRRGAVDFTEVTRAAIKALGAAEKPSDLLYWLDYRIEHLLVDEFQDTSLAQYDLINALTAQWSEGDGHTLFLVGDPMQSIYRFREAEVSLFLRSWEQQRLGAVRLTPVRLTTNFRSTPEILNWLTVRFRPMMSEEDHLHGAVRFRPSEASRRKGAIAPKIVRFIDDRGGKEASAVVEIVKGAVKRGTVAILVRSRSHVAAILPALREAGISYQAVEIDQLREQQHVLDLISLTRAILHLGDRASWLACLRAPWCGLTLADLAALAEHQSSSRTMLDLLSDPESIARLSSDGRSRALRVHKILSFASENVGHLPLRQLIEETWISLGGPAILHQKNQQEDADTYFDLVESFEQGGIIKDFSLLNQQLECLYAKPSDDDRVQVMTIYEAKGLEFDTVILPQLGGLTRRSDRDLLIWTEQIDHENAPYLLLAAQPQKGEEDSDYEFVWEEIKKKEGHELKRLFYVACTRACNELYMLGNARCNKDGTALRKASETTFLGLIWDTEQAEFESELRRRVPVQKDLFTAEESVRAETLLRRLPATWRAPRLAASVQWRSEFLHATASVDTATYDWVSGTGRLVGTVVHELLNRVAKQGSNAWPIERLNALKPVIKSELLRLGVPRPDEPKASAQVIRAITNTLMSERGGWILHSHAEARSEWPIAGYIQDRLISGTIDRVFRDKEGSLWIIDFKTSAHEGGRLETFLDNEQRRYRAQLESYATLMSRLANGPVWLGLYFPLLDGWRAWQFEGEAALSA
jgi:ATP-dependent helicase/nuclease subunit A